MNRNALGLVEVSGIAASLEAADVMAKAAEVRVLASEYCGNAVTVVLQGDAVHIRAALEAALAAPGLEGKLITHAMIPVPHRSLELLLPAAD